MYGKNDQIPIVEFPKKTTLMRERVRGSIAVTFNFIAHAFMS